MHIVYSPHYNISFFGIERLHPFDSRKYGRAWRDLRKRLGAELLKNLVGVDRPVRDDELAFIHTANYLASLRSSACIAACLEIPVLRFLPAWLLHWRVLRPMKWAVRGSVLAARLALKNGWAVNLSGGYHHAKPDRGEGFCVFSDIALIVHQLRREKLLGRNDNVIYVDLDAHQGNGVCHQFLNDPTVFIFDMYNRDIYPRADWQARDRIDSKQPVAFNCTGAEYLRTLRNNLPPFLESLARTSPRLAIYNAGTDVFVRDKLGGMCLSAEDVLARDLFVVSELRRHQLPFVMLLSGGYSPESYRLVAGTVASLIENVRESSAREH
jgi:histone deacetylase 11